MKKNLGGQGKQIVKILHFFQRNVLILSGYVYERFREGEEEFKNTR